MWSTEFINVREQLSIGDDVLTNDQAVFYWLQKTGQNLKDYLPIILTVSIFNNFVAFIYLYISVCLYMYAWFLWPCTVQDNL